MEYVDELTTTDDNENELVSIESSKNIPEASLTFSNLKSRAFIEIFIFKFLSYIPFIAGGIFIPLYGAQWFGNCLINNKNEVNPDCTPDYSTFAFFSTLFQSIGGLVAFTFSAFIGRLTDAYGRKYFYLIGVICWFLPRTLMCFYVNFYIYFAVAALADLNAHDLAIKGGISDIIQGHKKVKAFGQLAVATGGGLFIGTAMAVVISSVWNNHTVFYALTIVYILIMFYIVLFMKETIDINDNRRPLKDNTFKNPLKPLKYAFKNKLLLYVSLIYLFITLAGSGVISCLFAYIGKEMKMYDDGKASLIFGIYTVVLSISMVLANGILLPFVKKRMNDTSILCLAFSIKICSFILLILVSFYPNIVVLMLSSFLFGGSWFAGAVGDAIISNYVNKSYQGTAFGIVTSYTQVAAIIGPFSSGYLYVALDKANLPYVFIIIAIFFTLCAIILVLIPLKNELGKLERYKCNNDINGHVNMDNVEIVSPKIKKEKVIALVRLINDDALQA